VAERSAVIHQRRLRSVRLRYKNMWARREYNAATQQWIATAMSAWRSMVDLPEAEECFGGYWRVYDDEE
jgi:hypothetical protein